MRSRIKEQELEEETKRNICRRKEGMHMGIEGFFSFNSHMHPFL
jgi:hypothetical protein